MELTRTQAVAVLDGLKFYDVGNWTTTKMQDKLGLLSRVPQAAEAVAAMKDGTARGLAEQVLRASNRNQSVTVRDDDEDPDTYDLTTVNEESAEMTDEIDDDAGETAAPVRTAKPAAKAAVNGKAGVKAPAKVAAKAATNGKVAPANGAAKAVNGKPAVKAATPAKEKAEKPAGEAVPRKEKVGVDRFNRRLGSAMSRVNDAITGTPQTAKEIMAKAAYEKPIYGHLNNLVNEGFVEKVDGKYRVKGAVAGATPKAKVKAKA